MRETAELFALVSSVGIELRWTQLRPYFDGVYLREPPRRPYIYLDRDLAHEPLTLRVVLAEELGHHFTLGPGVVALPGQPGSDLAEVQAWCWAAHYLVPDKELEGADCRALNLCGLADYFQVPVSWMRRRLKCRRWSPCLAVASGVPAGP